MTMQKFSVRIDTGTSGIGPITAGQIEAFVGSNWRAAGVTIDVLEGNRDDPTPQPNEATTILPWRLLRDAGTPLAVTVAAFADAHAATEAFIATDQDENISLHHSLTTI